MEKVILHLLTKVFIVVGQLIIRVYIQQNCEHRIILTNLETLFATDKGITQALGDHAVENLKGRANYRCTSRDYLPIVGPVPDISAFLASFKPLRNNASIRLNQKGAYLPNLYVTCSMGSRGLSYAPLAAELIASEISGEIPPLERDLRLAMHPARFIIRDLKRRKI